MLPWTAAFAGLLCLAIVTFGISAVKGGGGKVEALAQPYTGTIDPPGTTGMGGDAALQVGTDQGPEQPVACEDLLLMVGPDHKLTPDYVPPDLVYLSTYGIWARGTEDMLRQEVAEQLALMISAAEQDGVELLVASGYRSYWEQKGTFAWFKDAYGEEAGNLSVPPGQSEHQLGTAVDFASSEVNYELVSAFAQTSAGMWLDEHADRYGFVMSYGKDRESDTGVSFEPWHYRYIGVDNALEVEAAGENTRPLYREGVPQCYEAEGNNPAG